MRIKAPKDLEEQEINNIVQQFSHVRQGNHIGNTRRLRMNLMHSRIFSSRIKCMRTRRQAMIQARLASAQLTLGEFIRRFF
jgi:hypothetical protein